MIELGNHQQSRLNRTLYVLPVSLAIILLFVRTSAAQSCNPVHIVPHQPQVASAGDPAAPANTNSGSPTSVSDGLKLQPNPLQVDVDLVLVPVIVTDTLNRPVIGLGKDSFELLDEGRAQQIRYFSLEDEPLSIALVLDISNSMQNRISIERDALTRFFENAHPDDEYFAIGVSSKPVVLADSTQAMEDIQSRLALIQPSGYTALLDSIHLALNKLKSARYPRRVVLIISDGGENDSRFNYRETKELAEESDALVYAIRPVEAIPMFRTIEEKLGNHLLSGITEATGGRTVSLAESDNIPGAAAAISTELRSQYVLGYHLPGGARDGKPHKIKVRMLKARDSTSFHLQYRKRYLAGIK